MKRMKSVELNLLSERSLGLIHAGSGSGQPMPGLGSKGIVAVPMREYLLKHPLPPTSRDILGNMPRITNDKINISANGGTNMPPEIALNAIANKDSKIASVAFAGSSDQNFNNSISFGGGFRFGR
jgi:hypothetical protein